MGRRACAHALWLLMRDRALARRARRVAGVRTRNPGQAHASVSASFVLRMACATRCMLSHDRPDLMDAGTTVSTRATRLPNLLERDVPASDFLSDTTIRDAFADADEHGGCSRAWIGSVWRRCGEGSRGVPGPDVDAESDFQRLSGIYHAPMRWQAAWRATANLGAKDRQGADLEAPSCDRAPTPRSANPRDIRNSARRAGSGPTRLRHCSRSALASGRLAGGSRAARGRLAQGRAWASRELRTGRSPTLNPSTRPRITTCPSRRPAWDLERRRRWPFRPKQDCPWDRPA